MAIRTLIVEDVEITQQMLITILNSDPEIEVVGTAANGILGLRKVKELDPDVITCDIEMPQMSGLSFIKKLMAETPKPVVVVSAYTRKTCALGLKAMELGAVEVIQKLGLDAEQQDLPLDEYTALMNYYRQKITTAVKTAGRARIMVENKKRFRPRPEADLKTHKPPLNDSDIILAYCKPEKRHLIDEIIAFQPRKKPTIQSNKDVIAIGASVGGTVAIGKIMGKLPSTLPGIVITQHIPDNFATAFAKNLDTISQIEVREARDGDLLKPGTALVAPGDVHMVLDKNIKGYFIRIKDGIRINRHKPSVDVLFRSVANVAGPKAIGVILTGMSDDGAVAMKDMHDNGAFTIAQDEASCLVFGMPKQAIERGGVDKVAPLKEISNIIIQKAGIGK